MARKTKRRSFTRTRVQRRTEDPAERRHRLEGAARTLLSQFPGDAIARALSEREFLLAEADRAAQLEPSPANLTRYRAAQLQCEVARFAVELGGMVATGDGADD
ncbi:MAG: hypothetical protein U0821_00530 [Chloroflexota bacterium]